MAGIVGLTEIQHQNGTSAMTVDASGRITTPARPAFMARGDASLRASGADTVNGLTLNSNNQIVLL